MSIDDSQHVSRKNTINSGLLLGLSLMTTNIYADPQSMVQALAGHWQGNTQYAQSQPTEVNTQVTATLTPDNSILTLSITYNVDDISSYAIKVMSVNNDSQQLYSSYFHDNTATLVLAEIIDNQSMINALPREQASLSNHLPFSNDSNQSQKLNLQYQGEYQQRPVRYLEQWQLSSSLFINRTWLCYQDEDSCQYIPLSTSKLQRVDSNAFE
ncbi:hypothetical protein [Shewanella sp. NIFS-20-20]|uniref:hypothetical protein n=1 Tax=Shewanella sp. NIFS-20-20 TaxID=2853806 RepID=UPI001C468A2D|nr:hypothetical protein [Shewanella sp. NIFS-20-20]MBV7315865.1 hypothetical protein [Shewanella sp. NIFS-20-20]